MPFASISGGRLYYELEGPVGAPVLLFSNSLGTNLEMWRPQVPVLSRNFRLLRYDTRGHGQSSASHGAYTAEQLANDVLLMLDQFGIAQVSFCGLSMGGVIGMSLASRAPERLTKLILCSTALRIGTAESWNQRISTVQHQGMEAIADAVLGRWFSPEFLD